MSELKGHHPENIIMDMTVEELSGSREAALLDRVSGLITTIARLRKVLEEVALPPYADSDLSSLLDTLRTRAKAALQEPTAPSEDRSVSNGQ